MLELIGTTGHETISTPDACVLATLRGILDSGNPDPLVAEIGIGIGATTLPMAEMLAGRGQLHLFDFRKKAEEIASDLAERGFFNVVAHGNSRRHWDSYHWSLARLIEGSQGRPGFDLMYIDGAHTYLHDGLAFCLCDRLLKSGGYIVFDDYYWRFADSGWMKDVRHDFMTAEQEDSRQIQMIVDTLVRTHPGYREVIPNVSFQKQRPRRRSPR